MIIIIMIIILLLNLLLLFLFHVIGNDMLMLADDVAGMSRVIGCVNLNKHYSFLMLQLERTRKGKVN